MLLDLVGFLMCVAPIVGLLVWRRELDHRAVEAGVVRADIHAGVTRALGGETFLAIDVRSPVLWWRGHVRLSAPTGYEGLIGAAAPTVFDRLPSHYDVIIHCGGNA
jgi:hypothetical protein